MISADPKTGLASSFLRRLCPLGIGTRPRRPLVFWLLGTLALAVAVHVGAILLYPYLLMFSFHRQLVAHGGRNTVLHGTRPTANDRQIRLPSPDLLYSAAAYDLSEAPLRITAPLTGSYMSVSLYAANTDNFFVMNDRQVAGDRFDFALIGPRTPDPSLRKVRVIRSPSRTGIVLFRFFAGEADQSAKIEAVRQQIRCTPLVKPDARTPGS